MADRRSWRWARLAVPAVALLMALRVPLAGRPTVLADEKAPERTRKINRAAGDLLNPFVSNDRLLDEIHDAIDVDFPDHRTGASKQNASPPSSPARAAGDYWRHGGSVSGNSAGVMQVPEYGLEFSVRLDGAVDQVWIDFQKDGKFAGQVILDAFTENVDYRPADVLCRSGSNYLRVTHRHDDIACQGGALFLRSLPAVKLQLVSPRYGGPTGHGITKGVHYSRVDLYSIAFRVWVPPRSQRPTTSSAPAASARTGRTPPTRPNRQPRPTDLSIVINGGAVETADPGVVLRLRAQYTYAVRYRNEGGAWSGWETYTDTKRWRLSPGDGPKRVSCQAKNYENVTGDVVSATIRLVADRVRQEAERAREEQFTRDLRRLAEQSRLRVAERLLAE